MRTYLVAFAVALLFLVGCGVKSVSTVSANSPFGSYTGNALGAADTMMFSSNGGTSQDCGPFTYSVVQPASSANGTYTDGQITINFTNLSNNCPISNASDTYPFATNNGGHALTIYYPQNPGADYWWQSSN